MSRIVILAKKAFKCKTFFTIFSRLFQEFLMIMSTAVSGACLIPVICKHYRIFNGISKA